MRDAEGRGAGVLGLEAGRLRGPMDARRTRARASKERARGLGQLHCGVYKSQDA